MKDIWKNRLDKLTYNLIYPAFIGNMIYDLLLRKLAWTDDELIYPNLWICFTIVVFLLIDFMHLHGDMNKIVSQPERKTWRYILIDIATATFVFLSFVFYKEGKHEFGLIFFTLIPFGILWYKWKNEKARIYFGWYSGGALIFVIIIFCLGNSYKHHGETILLYSILSTLSYFYFIAYYYVPNCKEIDEGIMIKPKSLY